MPALTAAVVGIAALEVLAARAGLLRAGPSPQPGQPSRRGLLALGGAGVGAAALGGTGQALIARNQPSTITLPAAAEPLPPLAKGVEVGKAGVSPFVTPNGDFYRIDTALLAPRVHPGDWTLTIDGDVPDGFTLDIDELLDLPMVERDITLNCVSSEVGGDLVGHARWLGVPTRELLSRAGIDDDPRDPDLQVLSTSTDGMTISTPLSALLDDRGALVAVGMNGAPLPREHGFPARLVTPGLYGFVGATKWLTRMTVTRYDADPAYWTERDWATDGTVKTQSRIDTLSPLARIEAGRTVIGGVAWAQRRGIERVEVRVDDGPWRRATLGAEANVDCWRQWFLPWGATEGRHDITVRATGGEGEVQALASAAALVLGGGVATWQAETADGGTVEVIHSDSVGRSVLRVEGLADPGEGKAYQAWLQDDEGHLSPAGVMDDSDGEMVLDGDLEDAEGVGVSAEPAAGSEQPTSDPIALVELG